MTIYGMAATALATLLAFSIVIYKADKACKEGHTKYFDNLDRLMFSVSLGMPTGIILIIVILIIAWIDK